MLNGDTTLLSRYHLGLDVKIRQSLSNDNLFRTTQKAYDE